MSFGFTAGYTQGPNPNTASATAGDAFASFLLGYPATGDFTGVPRTVKVEVGVKF